MHTQILKKKLAFIFTKLKLYLLYIIEIIIVLPEYNFYDQQNLQDQ